MLTQQCQVTSFLCTVDAESINQVTYENAMRCGLLVHTGFGNKREVKWRRYKVGNVTGLPKNPFRAKQTEAQKQG